MDSKHKKPRKAGLPIDVVRWKDFMREIGSNILLKFGVDKPMTGAISGSVIARMLQTAR